MSHRDLVRDGVREAMVTMLRAELAVTPGWWALVAEALAAADGDGPLAGRLIGQRLLSTDREPAIRDVVLPIAEAASAVFDDLVATLGLEPEG